MKALFVVRTRETGAVERCFLSARPTSGRRLQRKPRAAFGAAIKCRPCESGSAEYFTLAGSPERRLMQQTASRGSTVLAPGSGNKSAAQARGGRQCWFFS